MKTNKKQSSVPKEVRQYEQARMAFLSAMAKVEKLRNSPAVTKFMKIEETKKQSPKPLTEKEKQEQRQKELVMLCGMFQENYYRIGDYLRILIKLSEVDQGVAPVEIDDIGDMLDQIYKSLWDMRSIGGRTFQLLGIVNDNMIGEDEIKERLKDDDAFYVYRDELKRESKPYPESPWFEHLKQGIRFTLEPSGEKSETTA